MIYNIQYVIYLRLDIKYHRNHMSYPQCLTLVHRNRLPSWTIFYFCQASISSILTSSFTLSCFVSSIFFSISLSPLEAFIPLIWPLIYSWIFIIFSSNSLSLFSLFTFTSPPVLTLCFYFFYVTVFPTSKTHEVNHWHLLKNEY